MYKFVEGYNMLFFQNKLLVILAHLLLFLMDFANMFLTDIMIYEVTEGVSFDYNAMLHNVIFWVLLVLHLLHIIVTIFVNKKNDTNDEAVKEAIAREQIKLLSQTTLQTKKGNFEEADNVLKIYDKLAKRRNR